MGLFHVKLFVGVRLFLIRPYHVQNNKVWEKKIPGASPRMTLSAYLENDIFYLPINVDLFHEKLFVGTRPRMTLFVYINNEIFLFTN